MNHRKKIKTMKTNNILQIAAFCFIGYLSTLNLAIAQTTIDNLTIQKNDSVIVSAGTIVNNLVICADKNNAGQLIIESGIITVKRMTYRFTITPAEYTMISFPTNIPNLNAPTASNLAQLGITQNSGTKRYLLKYYDSESRSYLKEPWTQLTTSSVKANKGYLIYVVTGTTTPTEIEFYYNNLTLDKDKASNQVLVDLDMAGKLNLNDYQMQIKPSNMRGNTLNITVHNDQSSSPKTVNYKEAVENAKIYLTEDQQAFRISLPSSENCKVLILNKKMKKVIQAIDYVSPGEIPISKLKKGTYNVYIEYGGAAEMKVLNVK